MLVDPVRPPQSSAPERRNDHPPRKPREPISGDSRTSLGLGATGTVAASIAGHVERQQACRFVSTERQPGMMEPGQVCAQRPI
ncbi:hypothetical protein E5288_WYG017907 [Bos mutus]|uniref:Uncharacterized protein n=1 Tax=Bos mutus TaxID=72004 RepID=A0A6B0SCQ7_9CETA|nr:hypothetical protein [Bos mutus]